jgi:hypothetical protein
MLALGSNIGKVPLALPDLAKTRAFSGLDARQRHALDDAPAQDQEHDQHR